MPWVSESMSASVTAEHRVGRAEQWFCSACSTQCSVVVIANIYWLAHEPVDEARTFNAVSMYVYYHFLVACFQFFVEDVPEKSSTEHLNRLRNINTFMGPIYFVELSGHFSCTLVTLPNSFPYYTAASNNFWSISATLLNRIKYCEISRELYSCLEQTSFLTEQYLQLYQLVFTINYTLIRPPKELSTRAIFIVTYNDTCYFLLPSLRDTYCLYLYTYDQVKPFETYFSSLRLSPQQSSRRRQQRRYRNLAKTGTARWEWGTSSHSETRTQWEEEVLRLWQVEAVYGRL